jgi:hypothetical protein
MADGSGCIASARVGSRQSFKKAETLLVSAFSFSALAFRRNYAKFADVIAIRARDFKP